MIKESDFKKYFENQISIQTLIDIIRPKEIERNIPEALDLENLPRITKISFDAEFHDLKGGDFILTKNHLRKLCDEFLSDNVSAWQLEDIAFILYGCDGISWGNDENERKLIADIMFRFSSPEINEPLTKESVKKIKQSLEKLSPSFTMHEKEMIKKIIDLLSQIKNESKNQSRAVRLLEDFLDSIPREDKFWDSEVSQFLADFKYDLGYYQPNKWIRLTNPGLFGDDKLLIKINQLLKDLES